MDLSFNILAAQHRPMVVCYLRTLVGDVHVAEDLAQETFVAAYESLERFQDGANFGAWLRGIARHKALDQQRKAARLPLVFDTHVVEGMEEVFTLFDSPTSDGAVGFERLAVINRCLAELSDSLRQAVEHVYQRGKSLREAADALGTSFAAVGQRLSRARTLIRKCVTRRLEEEARG